MTSDDGRIRAVLDVEHRTFAAIRDKNVGVLAEILADDFLYRAPGAPDVRKTEFLHNLGAIPVEIVDVRGEDMRADAHGDAVVVTGVQRATTRAPDGSLETGSVAFTDVFVRRDGRWLLVLAYGVELGRNCDESIAPERSRW